jgi:hypothetical protein
MNLAGLGTKNKYTGEGQQLFIQPNDRESTGVSEEYVASIFMVKEYAKQETRMKNVASGARIELEAKCSSETLDDFQQTTRGYISEDTTVYRTISYHKALDYNSNIIFITNFYIFI